MASSQANGTANTATTESTKPAARSTPKDALVMSSILREMGISDYEPRVVNQMLEFTYRKFCVGTFLRHCQNPLLVFFLIEPLFCCGFLKKSLILFHACLGGCLKNSLAN